MHIGMTYTAIYSPISHIDQCSFFRKPRSVDDVFVLYVMMFYILGELCVEVKVLLPHFM